MLSVHAHPAPLANVTLKASGTPKAPPVRFTVKALSVLVHEDHIDLDAAAEDSELPPLFAHPTI